MHNRPYKIINLNTAGIRLKMYTNNWATNAICDMPDNVDVIISTLANGLPTLPLVMLQLEDGTYIPYDDTTECVLNILRNIGAHNKSLSNEQYMMVHSTEFQCLMLTTTSAAKYEESLPNHYQGYNTNA